MHAFFPSLSRVLVPTAVCIGMTACSATQDAGVRRSAARPDAASPDAVFPDAWVGAWSGTLEMLGERPSEGSIRMELVIAPTAASDRYRWTIIYDGAAGRQERNYELVVRDKAAGVHAIDERNGIVLETRELGGAIFSWFSLGGANVIVREQLLRDDDGERIDVELITALDRDTVTTGPNGEVRSLAPVSVQRASLRRREP
jgi:hypothetical protein